MKKSWKFAAILFTSILVGGCGAAPGGHSGMTDTRYGHYPIQNFDTDDKKARYDSATHILTSPDARLKVYFPSEPGAIPHKYEIHDANSMESVDFEGWYRYLLPGEKLDLVVLFLPGSVSNGENMEETRAGVNKCVTSTLGELHFIESSRHPITPPDGLVYGVEAKGKLAAGTDMFKLHLYTDKDGVAYKLLALGPEDQINGPEATKFFDSLAVSKF